MNKKTLFISMGSIIAAIAPVAIVVSCGRKIHKAGYIKPKYDSSTGKIEFEKKGSLASLKTDLQNRGVSLDDLNKLTMTDIQNFTLGNTKEMSGDKLDIFKKVDAVLRHWTFAHNNDADEMNALNSYFNNSGINTFASQSPGRQPVKGDSSKGKVYYYRGDLVDLVHVSDFENSVDLLDSRIKQSALNAGANRKYVTYNVKPNPKKGNRLADYTTASGSTFTSVESAATSFSIFRTKTVGKDIPQMDENTGDISFSKTKKVTNDLYAGLDIKLQDAGNDVEVQGRKLEDLEDAFKNNPNADTIVFSNNSEEAHYAKSINGKIVKSSVFKAKDLFYGLVRALYTSKEVWKNGMLNGEDVSSALPKLTDAQIKQYLNLFEGATDKDKEASATAAGNSNFYLLDLFGIDVVKTVEANKNAPENKFILKFKSGIKPSTVGFFENNSMITPFPKARLTHPDQPNLINGENIGIFGSYGNPYSGLGASNVDDVDVLSPFVYTNASYDEGGTIETRKNPFYIDQAWVNNNNTFSGSILRKASGTDPIAAAQAADKRFRDALSTGEYSVESSVANNSELISKLAKYIYVENSVELGKTSAGSLYWNFYAYGDAVYNDEGRKIMYGEGDKDIITNSTNAADHYFKGDGALLRDSIHAAVNWQSLIETMNPGQNKVFYPSLVMPGDFNISGLKPEDAYPDFMDSLEESKNIYNSNKGDKAKSWTSSKVAEAAKTLDELADKYNITSDKPANIPLFVYSFSGDAKGDSSTLDANEQILKRLNSLSDKIQFKNPFAVSWTEFITQANQNKTYSTIITGFGPDYAGIGSQMYQMLKSTSQLISIAKASFE